MNGGRGRGEGGQRKRERERHDSDIPGGGAGGGHGTTRCPDIEILMFRFKVLQFVCKGRFQHEIERQIC